MKYELTQEDVNIITGIADLALKASGLQNMQSINYIVEKFKNPLPELGVEILPKDAADKDDD